MTSEESIFADAIGLPPASRLEYVEQACGDDDALKRRVRQLLEAHDKTDSFLGSPVGDKEATVGVERHVIGNYRLLQKIGEGGFGVVYMAEQTAPVRRKVALKIIKPGMDSQAVVARFEAERQALAIMDHPNIARVFDGGTIEAESADFLGSGRPYFVMELVNGIPITEYCDRNALSNRQRLPLFVSVCQAVQHAHVKGIIHRDIKPSNVMVTLHDGRPVVKVIDFGVAKALHQRLTERTMFTEYGQMLGTPQYMSPEQAEMSGLDVDTRSDIYSLAVLLYELLTGTTPLEAGSLRAAGFAEMQRLIREQQPLRPSLKLGSTGDQLTAIAKHRSASPERLHREVQGDLDWIVMKGLEKDRNRRYESASSFAKDVQRMLDDEPVEARPPSSWYRLKKYVQRHRAAVAAAGVVVVLVAALGVVGLLARQAWHERRQRDSAQLSRALDEISAELGSIAGSAHADSADWISLAAGQQRLKDLIASSDADPRVISRARRWMLQFEEARRERELSSDVENLLVNRATRMDLTSWTLMEEEFREIFRDFGLDLDQLEPREVGRRIFNDPARERLADALELWIGTRGQMATFGGPRLTAEIMQPWADAIYAADPDPLRTGIRRVIYGADPATRDHLDRLTERVDLTAASARTLSWLAVTYMMAKQPDRSNEIHQLALRRFPDDLMLNFDYALTLYEQEKWEQSIRYYMRCTALRPHAPGIWRGLGAALQANGELSEALDALTHATTLDALHAPGWLDLARTQLDASDFSGSLASSRRVIELDSQLAEGWQLRGRAHMALQDYAAAQADLQRCRELTHDAETLKSLDAWLDECRSKLKPDDE